MAPPVTTLPKLPFVSVMVYSTVYVASSPSVVEDVAVFCAQLKPVAYLLRESVTTICV